MCKASIRVLKTVLCIMSIISLLCACSLAVTLVPWDGDTAKIGEVLKSPEVLSIYLLIYLVISIASITLCLSKVKHTVESYEGVIEYEGNNY